MKTVLIIGMARSGIAAAPVMKSLGYRVILNDSKPLSELSGLEDFDFTGYECRFGEKPDALVDEADEIIVSPSVPLNLPYAARANQQGKEVLAELEKGYRLCKAQTVAITGTNGKTTTTTLTGEIFKNAGRGTFVVGNIGEPYMAHALEAKEDDVMVTEVSSYQLEGITDFKAHAAALLNITEDHMIRHKTMENYIAAKMRVFENQTRDDFSVLNADDTLVEGEKNTVSGTPFLFSRTKDLGGNGCYVKNGVIVFALNGKITEVLSAASVRIPGPHNLENALAAVSLTMLCGVDAATVAKTLTEFAGVEHRIETVCTKGGITYINDSKGTNPDSTVKAIQTMTKPTVLLLGGYDKGGSFDAVFEALTDNIKYLVLFGATRFRLQEAADRFGITNYTLLDAGFEEAVSAAANVAQPGWNVLLSPACASFDMFTDYEERGRVFKQLVSKGK